MKRSLIVLAVAGVLANAAFAEPTLTGDDTYDQVHFLGSWRNAPEAISFRSESRAAEESAQVQSAPYGQPGIYNFNP
jgi:hypothetical protein